MENFKEGWKIICDYLRQEKKIVEVAYKTWISRIEPVSIDFEKGVITLLVPNEFHRQTLIRGYLPKFEEAYEQVFGTSFETIFLIPEESEKLLGEETSADTGYEFTFDTFIVGSSNKFAHAASLAVAQNPASAYNPLFLYGNSGLGKTHLLYAIGNEIRKTHPDYEVIYIKGEDFANEIIQSIMNKTTAQFRQKYRRVDVLLVDDVQFIGGKESTQEEFFHTFDALHDAKKQIVLSSDRPPKDMDILEERFRSRFEWGMTTDIKPPDLETRMAITRNKAAQLGLILSDEAVSYIAEKITSNIRRLEGVIKKLTAYKEILNEVITLDSVKRAIQDVIKDGIFIPTPEIIIRETARYFQLSEEDLRGQSRSKNTAMARQISMYLMRTLTDLSLQAIGEQYEGRNHATVLSSIRKVENLIQSDPRTATVVRDITSNINSNERSEF